MKYTKDNPLKVIELFSGIGSQRSALEKAESVCSNTQLYKQAGNSIVISVMSYIFKNLFK